MKKKHKKFTILYDGKYIETISALYKKNVWDYIRNTIKYSQKIKLFTIVDPFSESMKCYIAGKIGNLPIDVYTKLFEAAEQKVKSMGMCPVSPLRLPHLHDKKWNSFMREDLVAMLKCDSVYALANWKDSPGAKIEISIAMKLGMNLFFENESDLEKLKEIFPTVLPV